MIFYSESFDPQPFDFPTEDWAAPAWLVWSVALGVVGLWLIALFAIVRHLWGL